MRHRGCNTVKLIREGRASCGEGGVGVKAPQAGLCLLAGKGVGGRQYLSQENTRESRMKGGLGEDRRLVRAVWLCY